MTFSSEKLQRAREVACERRTYAGIQRLLMDEFNLRPAQCRALLSVSTSAEDKSTVQPYARN